MQKGIGVIGVIIGVLLLVWGHNIANSVGSQVEKVFTGAPTDRVMQLYLSGAVIGLSGLLLIFWKRK